MKTRYTIPLAILAAGVVIAASVFVTLRVQQTTQKADPSLMRPVDSTDHILGNPAAPVMFVEYTDVNCAFCKNYQATMERLVAAYGAKGQVALTYRYLPLVAQDPNAEAAAEAAECAAKSGGTSALFKFVDAVAKAAPGNTPYDPSGYAAIAASMGLDTDAFTACVTNHTSEKRVAADASNALAAGATGAPYTLLLIQGQQGPLAISGALSYDQMNALVLAALAKIQGS